VTLLVRGANVTVPVSSLALPDEVAAMFLMNAGSWKTIAPEGI
jgi:hypothetical protein